MAVNPNEDTEFNDALRKYGILPQKEPTPPSPSPPPSPTLDDLLDDATLEELKELAEDTTNEEEERRIEAYRRQRILKERKEEKKGRFGRVYPISREDYTREVTEASKINEEDDEYEEGTGIVCFLYKDGIPRSDRTFQHVRTLAARYPRTKFVSIVGDKCIPNLPDSRTPMLIIYKKGEIRNQIIAWGSDKERKIEELEALLLVTGALPLPDLPPAHSKPKEEEDIDDECEDEERKPQRSGMAFTNGRAPRNIRSSRDNKDDDSDFEFDL